jgi:hypothetical protein
VAAPDFFFTHRIKEKVLRVTRQLVTGSEQGGLPYLRLDISVYEVPLS